MGSWQPRALRRFVQGFPTSARTAFVETDAGPGFVKAMGGPEGPHTLASEVVATQLAAWFQLPTFDWCLIDIDEIDEIPFMDSQRNRTGQATPGPAFITRAEQGTVWGGGDRQLKLLVNPQDISRLVVFDTWVSNCDRHGPIDPRTLRRRKPNRDNVFLSEEAPSGQFLLKAMDHTHCFSSVPEWTQRLSRVDTIKDDRLFGVFPEFRRYLRKTAVRHAANDLRSITSAVVRTMIQRVPDEWEVTQVVRDALVDLVVGRAAYVAETIESRIWPQGSLFAEGSWNQ